MKQNNPQKPWHKSCFNKVFCSLLLFGATACQTTLPPALPVVTAAPVHANSNLLPRASLQNNAPFYALTLSPSGRTIAMGGQKQLQLIDAAQNSKVQNIETIGALVSLTFSPDENLLAAGAYQYTTLWDIRNGQRLARLGGQKHYITALSFSPDGKHLATGSAGERTEIIIWNMTNRQQESVFRYDTPYADSLQALQFSPDGRHLAAAGRDHRVRLWATKTAPSDSPPVQTLTLPRMNPNVLAFSPDGQMIAVGTTEGAILIYDWRQGTILKTLQQHRGPVQALAFQNPGQLLRSVGQDQLLLHWHLQSGKVIKTENLVGGGTQIRMSQNAKTLVAQGPLHTDIFVRDANKKHGPQIVIHTPTPHETAFSATTHLLGKITDDLGLTEISIQINNIIWASNTGQATRDLKPVLRLPRTTEVIIDEHIPLRAGENLLTITARNTQGYSQSSTLKIRYAPERGKVWAAIIGISQYQHVAGLKYADADAQAFYDYLVNDNQIPKNQITLLLNQDASLQNLRDLLGVELPQKARKQDTVIIYYAGHGAPEPDRGSEDGDGLEKYLLPYDADPKRLYSTAFPMSEIARIFPRLAAERVVMLQDTCFSGATGLKGRTIETAMFRASLSDNFLNRLTRGKGRVIISASQANEVSLERDDFGHGVFTHFLLESLRHGDIDGDGFISTTEAFRYVSEKVPAATGQNQNPVKKGIESSEIILGKVRTGQ